eukprot:Em0018g377a
MESQPSEGAEQGASDHEPELSRVAKEAFDNQRYESCLSALNKLLDARRRDPRVAHNRAVAQYLLSNLTLTDEFRKNLQAVNVQFDRESENGSGECNLCEKGVLLFNQALIHARLHQYTQATRILEELHKVSGALGETLSLQVSLLLIDMYICTYQLSKVSSHVESLETSMGAEGEGREEDKRYHMLHPLKARFHLLHKNVKACKKEVKSIAGTAGNTPCAHYFKANVEYLRRNFKKALKVLCSAPHMPVATDAGECLASFYFNNLGCVHHQLGKYSLAAHYFKKAIEENDAALNGFPPLDRATPLSGRPLNVLGVNCRHVILYNLGLQQLFAGYTMAAFDSLLEVVQVFHSNPCLWLRLAEACIASDAKNLDDLSAAQRNRSPVIRMSFGMGLHHKLAVVPVQARIKEHFMYDAHPHSAAMPAPTLEFASVCLRNALFLLPPMSTDRAPSSEGKDGGHDVSVSALPGPPIQKEKISNLRNAVLVCLSYVYHALGDPVTALGYAQQLLSTPQLPGGLKFLGQLYAAEAFILLDRAQEALQLLNPDSISDVSICPPMVATLQPNDPTEESKPSKAPSTESTYKSAKSVAVGMDKFPETVMVARAIMMFNLSSLYAVKKDFDRARKTLAQAVPLFGKDAPPQAILLSAFIELSQGKASRALQILHRHQPFCTGDTKKTSYMVTR